MQTDASKLVRVYTHTPPHTDTEIHRHKYKCKERKTCSQIFEDDEESSQ